MTRLPLAAALAALLLAGGAGAAGPGDTIRYDGHLEWDGKPYSGALAVKVHLYADAAGQSPLWSDEWTAVAVHRGAFRLHLGAQAPFGAALDGHLPLYLGLEVKRTGLDPDYVALVGTQRLNAAPTAFGTPGTVAVSSTISVQSDAVFEGDVTLQGGLTVKGQVTADSYPTMTVQSWTLDLSASFGSPVDMLLADIPAGAGFCFLSQARNMAGATLCYDGDGCPQVGECQTYAVGTQWHLAGRGSKPPGCCQPIPSFCSAVCFRWK